VRSVDLHVDRLKCGQTSRPVVGAEIQTCSKLRRVCALLICFWVTSVSFVFMYIFWSDKVALFIAALLSTPYVAISICSYTKILLTLRQRQARVQEDHQRQPDGGGMPLNIARYKKTVSSIAYVQLTLAICHAHFIIFVLTVSISGWSGVSADVVWRCAITIVYLNSSLKPDSLLLEDKRNRTKSERHMRKFCCS